MKYDLYSGNTHSLRECRTCGAEITKSAKYCPNCGAYRPLIMRNPVAAIFGMAACVFIFVFMLQTYTALFGSQAHEDTTATVVTPKTLWSAYQENEVNADNLYKDKLLSVSGEVVSITTYMEMPCVTIAVDGAYDGIICLFKKGTTDDKLMSLRAGDTAAIHGVCSGTHSANSVVIIDSPAFGNSYVYLNDCYVNSIKEGN